MHLLAWQLVLVPTPPSLLADELRAKETQSIYTAATLSPGRLTAKTQSCFSTLSGVTTFQASLDVQIPLGRNTCLYLPGARQSAVRSKRQTPATQGSLLPLRSRGFYSQSFSSAKVGALPTSCGWWKGRWQRDAPGTREPDAKRGSHGC